MILTNELKGKIVSKGFTQQDIAKYLGISTRTFNQKLKKGIFNSDQIFKMIKLLEIENPMSIFFAENVT
ncbi:MAG: helix-turn-helix domain-containing protein [Fusobacterium varium]|uniref:helix-turn-helix domain-containing protein n=1 Tax=Fusobacterium varium TaxID=856 RepID=UPI00242E324E|nr:helix-turn-helix domain-containing protein [Fusobacterium varium]MCI6031546.1 helix-turn-helix domain-containing protein [Fusobacterium varium]MDY4005183.1 helix-turn-helix domain-containing protein [Fusobacterium varium]